jgi:hypothetical protein
VTIENMQLFNSHNCRRIVSTVFGVNLKARAGLLLLFGLLLLPAVCLALTTKLALIDDIWCATRAGAVGNRGLLEFLYRTFVAGDISRFRWSYELEQNLRWFLFGPHLAAHHFVMCCYRIATAGLACRLVHKYTSRRNWIHSIAACYFPIAYGLFFPIVPECRIGLQEPLFSLLMLAAANLLLSRMDDSANRQQSDWLFVWVIILLAGMKEPAVPVAGLLFVFHFVTQIRRQQAHLIRNGVVLVFLIYCIARVAIAASNDSYSQAQANLSSLNFGWLFFRARETLETIVLWRSGFVWLTVLCGVFLMVGGGRMLSDLRGGKDRWPALLFILLFGVLFLMTAKMKMVLRYCEPTIWISSIVMGVGVAQLQQYLKSRIVDALAVAALLAIVMGNYLPFIDQFAYQANAREYENRFLNDLTKRLDQQNASEVLIFGISTDHPWGIRRSEPAILAKMFLEEYRPLILSQPAVRGIPIERSEKIHPGALLIGIASEQQLRKEIPNLEVEEIVEFKPSADTLAFRWRRMLTESFQRFHLCVADNWNDAGSPESIAGEPSWHIWRIVDIPR